MSQPAATLNSQVPVFDTKAAVTKSRKKALRQGEGEVVIVVLASLGRWLA